MSADGQNNLAVRKPRVHGISPVIDLDELALSTRAYLDAACREMLGDRVLDDLHQNLIALSCFDFHFPEQLHCEGGGTDEGVGTS